MNVTFLKFPFLLFSLYFLLVITLYGVHLFKCKYFKDDYVMSFPDHPGKVFDTLRREKNYNLILR